MLAYDANAEDKLTQTLGTPSRKRNHNCNIIRVLYITADITVFLGIGCTHIGINFAINNHLTTYSTGNTNLPPVFWERGWEVLCEQCNKT